MPLLPDLLTVDDLLSIDDSLLRTIPVPEWGRTVFLARPSAARRQEFDRSLPPDASDPEKVDTTDWAARIVALCLANRQGQFLCEPKEAIGLGPKLGGKSAAAIARLYLVARKLAAIGIEEEAEKNFESGPDCSSNSGSPNISTRPDANSSADAPARSTASS